MTHELAVALGSLSITGAMVSLVAHYTKGWIEKRANRMLWVVLLSMGGGGILLLLQLVPAPWWATILAVFGGANTVYALITQWLKPAANDSGSH